MKNLLLLSLLSIIVFPSGLVAECVDLDGDGYGILGNGSSCRTRRTKSSKFRDEVSISNFGVVGIGSTEATVTYSVSGKGRLTLLYGETNPPTLRAQYSSRLVSGLGRRKLQGLKPSTKYYYKLEFRKRTTRVESEILEFITKPAGVQTTTSSSTSTTVSTTSSSTSTTQAPVHDCFNFDLVSKIKSYQKPNLKRTATKTFNSLKDLQAEIDSRSDHGGAVLELSPGRYSFSGSGIKINNKRNLTVYSNPDSRAVLDGGNIGNFGVNISETEVGGTNNIEFIGFEITKTRYHGVFIGHDATHIRGGSNIYVAGNYIHEAANNAGAGITARNATKNGLITLEANEIFKIDLEGSGSGRGEGIYIGQGSNNGHYSKNVVIRGNHIHTMNGEAIDIKRASRDILIEYNKISGVAVHSQGAITLGIDNFRTQDYEANIVVRRNVVGDVTTMSKDGNGIVVGYDSLIEENLIYNIFSHSIDVYNDANGPDKRTTIRNNIIWNSGSRLPIRENVGTGNAGPNNPFDIVRSKNIVQNSATSGECEAKASDFLGPLNSLDGFSPKAR